MYLPINRNTDNPFLIVIIFMVVLALYHNCCQQSQKAHTAISLLVIPQQLFHPIRPSFACPQTAAIDFTTLLS